MMEEIRYIEENAFCTKEDFEKIFAHVKRLSAFHMEHFYYPELISANAQIEQNWYAIKRVGADDNA